MKLSWQTIDRYCAQIDLTPSKPVIDLSEISFVEPFGLIYLGLFIRYYNAAGKFFNVKLPKDAKVRAYLARQQFYRHFDFNREFVEQESAIRSISSTCWNDMKEIEKVDYLAEDIADEVKDLLIDNRVNAPVSEICEITAELVANFVEHSNQQRAVITIQWFPNMNWLSLAIGDCGIGVKKSLCSMAKYAFLENEPDRKVIFEAFRPGVTRKQEGGTGLTSIRQNVIDLRGKMVFCSNSGYLRIDKGKSYIGNMNFNLPGVQMEVSFPTGGKV